MARCMLYGVAEEATLASPKHQLSQFVDDVKQYAEADSFGGVAEQVLHGHADGNQRMFVNRPLRTLLQLSPGEQSCWHYQRRMPRKQLCIHGQL